MFKPPSSYSFWKKHTLFFLYTWLFVGFTLGTLTLSLPLRSMIVYVRSHQGVAENEKIIFIVLLVLFIFYSFLVAKWVVRWCFYETRRLQKIFIHMLILLPAIFSLIHWLNPSAAQEQVARNTLISLDQRFIAGPYPKQKDLERLKAKGYTGVVSLLNPAIVPFEPILMMKEKRRAKALGLQLISIPLFPWVNNTEKSRKKIQELANSTGGKYYVHCYLGKDRVRSFMSILDNATVHAGPSSTKTLVLLKSHLERGKVEQLSGHLVVGPMPNKLELSQLVVRGARKRLANQPIKVFVNLHRNRNKSKHTLIGYEKSVLSQYGVKFISSPLSSYPYDANAVLATAKKVKAIKDPTYVYDFFMAPRSTIMEGFVTAFKTNLPALPPTLFLRHMKRGAAHLIAPNVLTGPEPTYDEYGGYLYMRGIRKIIYIGKKKESLKKSRKIAAFLGLPWYHFDNLNNAKLKMLLRSGGPWYVFGAIKPGDNALLKLIPKGPAALKHHRLSSLNSSTRRRR